jgi:molecular chaperone GrpE
LTKETESVILEELEKTQDQGASTEECEAEEQEQVADEEEQVKDETKELKEQVAQLQEQLLRNAAELENFKRRINEERVRETKYRAQSLVANIIPAIDNFERALATTVEDEATATFLTGFKMIHTQLLEALTKEGVEVINTDGVLFDPTVHQAVMQEAVADVESGVVLEELQKGYKLKDRVIRPAMVKVSE